MYAVIRTGGKQYKVAPQDVLQIEKIEAAAGDAVSFSEVLMVAGEGEPRIGSPLLIRCCCFCGSRGARTGPKDHHLQEEAAAELPAEKRPPSRVDDGADPWDRGRRCSEALMPAAKASAKSKKSEAEAAQPALEGEAKKPRAKAAAAAASAPDAEPQRNLALQRRLRNPSNLQEILRLKFHGTQKSRRVIPERSRLRRAAPWRQEVWR